ncbi:MAG TPA: hypothetical protein VGY57_08130, partial [Vicinamibacterales bacterium]|nr:hypothetical protein [Vicinamibacterales bacterium]
MRPSRLWIVIGRQALLLVSVYESVGRLSTRLGVPVCDRALIGVERVITGGRLPLVSPALLPSWCVDVFSLAYLSYFALPLILIAALARTNRTVDAKDAVRTLLAAFYIHYALYVIVPAVGPARTPELPAAIRMTIANEGSALTRSVRRFIGAL